MVTAIALLSGLSAGHAGAQDTAVYDGSPSRIDLPVDITASVAAVCGFAVGAEPSGSYDGADLKAGFSYDFPFTLNCSTPLRVAIVSDNGGMLAPVAAPTGYSRLAPYEVALHLVGDSLSADGSCSAASLAAGAVPACAFIGPASASQGLRLGGPSHAPGSYLRVSAPAYAGSAALVASTAYVDRLTITLAASL
ncbi:MAG: hypothetical protein Q7T19_09700 [Caulobacter sp.]|nr:hypothetical protein [Caulobacter sp.]